MHHSTYVRRLLTILALLLIGSLDRLPAQTTQPQSLSSTTVNLRWGPRAGVARYRLQLARDSEFTDIVFDRIVTGNEHEISDLAPGRYFWRVAPLSTKPADFSSAGAIDVATPSREANRTAQPTPSPDKRIQATGANSIVAGGGWRTAVDEPGRPILAHLRAPDRFDVVVTNRSGVIFALDANSGVLLWSVRPRNQDASRSSSGINQLLTIRSRSGLDNAVVLAGALVTQIEGATGREIWHANVPAPASTGAVLNDRNGSEIMVVDNSLQRLFILDGTDGTLNAQVHLPNRVVGAPVIFDDQGTARIMLAFDNGHVEVRDRTGIVVRSGEAGSPTTTAPLFVKEPRGDLILVGTRSGLTAMNAGDLHPLGRVTIQGDAPRGNLMAEDLDGDGIAEVIMTTERGHVVALNAADGKIRWDATCGNDAGTLAFADINGDHVLDVFISSGQTFATALSGRDGSIIWKDSEAPTLVANHVAGLESRAMIAVPEASGVLLISIEPSRSGLRAIEFPQAGVRPNAR